MSEDKYTVKNITLENDTEREELLNRIEHTLNKIRPYIQADGGDVVLAGYENGIVTVSMTGACAGCMVASVDVSQGIREILMDEVPEVQDVRLLETNPYSSENPFY